MVAKSPAFEKAVEDSKKLKAKPDTSQLLELYALYKIANGEDVYKTAKPGLFDLKGGAKYNAWKQLVDNEGLSPEQAQERYVNLVEALKVEHGYDENKVPEVVGGN